MKILLSALVAVSGAFAFPDLMVQQPPACSFTTQQRTTISSGSYFFNDLLFQDASLESLKFDFLIQINAECLDLPLFYETDHSTIGSMSIEGRNMIRLSGTVKERKNQLILDFPSSDCLYELVQASITFDLPVEGCQMGQRLNVEEDLMQGDIIDSPDEVQLPKSINRMLLRDGLMHFEEYKVNFVRLSDHEQVSYRTSLGQIHFATSRARLFTTGDLSQRSEANIAVKAMCEYINQYTSYDPLDKLDAATVSVQEFISKWIKYSPEMNSKTTTGSFLPTSVAGLSLVQGLHRYVRDQYHAKWINYYGSDKRDYRLAYRTVRNAYSIAEKFIVGDLAVLANAEATAEAMCRYLNSRIDDEDRRVNFRFVPITMFLRKWTT